MPATSAVAVADPLAADLRNPYLAALLAWLIPGAGHLYQGRTAKGILFLVCILGTYLYGFYLGGGKVVYAAWAPQETRWAYLCQIGVGLPALPALLQAERVRSGRPPLGDFMAPPEGGHGDQLAKWNYTFHRYFELGTVYTMIAGLLNILAVYDAFAGPVPIESEDEDDDDEEGPNTPGGAS